MSPACDPNLASCIDSGVPQAATVDSSSRTVTIEPVLVTGDAGAQELLRRYDARRGCGPEAQSAAATCPAIGLGILNALKDPLSGLATSFHASLVCGKELRALSDCREQAADLEAAASRIADDCHSRGGTVSLGASSSEIICEVTP